MNKETGAKGKAMVEAEASAISLISSFQLSDSAFPAGSFASSNGLESMHRSGMLRTAADVSGVIAVYIRQQVGPSDCVAAGLACDQSDSNEMAKIRMTDALCAASKTVREVRAASIRSGTQLARCAYEFLGADSMIGRYHKEIEGKRAAGTYPAAFGVCCQSMKMTRLRASLMLLYGFAATTTGAAVRLGIIHHMEAQKVIHELKPVMASEAQKSCRADRLWQFCPRAEIMQISHERMDPKMFIT